VDGKALETAVGVTTDTEAIAALKAKGITTATKTLKLDLGGLASETPPFTLKPKTLANGRQDIGEFLVVDTTKLPAKTQTTTISIEVRS
jgi:hypothetical protein